MEERQPIYAVWRKQPEWLFEQAPEAILVFDDKLEYLDANPAACQLLRREYHDIVGKHVGDFSEDGPRLAARILEAQGATSVEETHTVLLPDNSSRVVEVVTRPNILPGVHVSFSRDITDKRQMQYELEHHNRLEAIGKLASGVAHDFNNMLTAILSYTDLQLQRTPEGDAIRRYALGIQTAAERAADTARQLLTFCRRQQMQFAETDLNQAVREASTLVQRLIGEDICLVVDLAPSLSPVWADSGQLTQVLVNLAINARDAMPEGGQLILATSSRWNDAHRREEISVIVSDSGTGIAPEVMPRIFDPFFTTKREGKGTGLGLSTVSGIVKQMRGQILVNSTPGRGTTVEVILPAVHAVPVLARASADDLQPLSAETGSE